MNLSRLIMGVIVVMMTAVQSLASEHETITKEAKTNAVATVPETVVELRIDMSISVLLDRNQKNHSVMPSYFEARQTYPNPFNATTTVEYDLPRESGVFATVYDILGRRIRILENNTRFPGSYQAEWDGMTDFGQPATTGVYFFVLLSDDNYAIRKMLLLK